MKHVKKRDSPHRFFCVCGNMTYNTNIFFMQQCLKVTHHKLFLCVVRWPITQEPFYARCILRPPDLGLLILIPRNRLCLGKPKKSYSLNGPAIFWNLFFHPSKISTAIKLEGGRGVREELFLRLPLGADNYSARLFTFWGN